MNLLDLLHTLGDRLGIIEAGAPQTECSHPKVQTRAVTLAELMTEIRTEPIRTLAEFPPELSTTPDMIFQAAGISEPGHGWTVERLMRLLRTDEFKGLQRNAIQHRFLELLRTVQVDVQELVKDAVARDRALDEFERSLGESVKKRRGTTDRRIAELDSRIRDLEAQRADLERNAETEREKWTQWLQSKRGYERELASAVSYLIDDAVITVDDSESLGPG